MENTAIVVSDFIVRDLLAGERHDAISEHAPLFFSSGLLERITSLKRVAIVRWRRER